MNVIVSLYDFQQMGMQMNPLMLAQPAHEEDLEDDDAMGVAETYSDYMPSKCKYCSLEDVLCACCHILVQVLI